MPPTFSGCGRILSLTLLTGSIASPAFPQCQTAKLVPSSGAPEDWFGFASALDGDVALVGAQFHDAAGMNSGIAYVFRRNGRNWVQETEIAASDELSGDLFGCSVALQGNRALMGSSQDDFPGTDNAGSAYVVEWNGSQWVEVAKLVASDAVAGDAFGTSVAVDGDLAVVGAVNAGNNLTGAVYVYRFDGSQWIEEAKLTASDAVLRDYFGYSVAVENDVIVVGAYYTEATFEGKSYVYRYDGTSWTEEQILIPSDPANLNYFGISVSIDQGRIVVGAQGNSSAATRAGKAYVFEHDGVSWVETAQLVASDAEKFDFFGVSVDVEGDRVVVGAIADDDNATNAGSVYLYEHDGVTWNEVGKLTAEDPLPIDELGRSVSISGEFILSGAFWADDSGTDSGAAYVFFSSDDVASWSNYGSGWPGTLGEPALTLSADPVLGTSVDLTLENSLGSPTSGMILIGFSQAAIPTNVGGTLLVLPNLILPLALIPAPDLTLPLHVACNPNLSGVSAYLQTIEFDFGASAGVAFTRGLQMTFGF